VGNKLELKVIETGVYESRTWDQTYFHTACHFPPGLHNLFATAGRITLYELRPPVSFQDTVIFALLLFCFRTESQTWFHTSVWLFPTKYPHRVGKEFMLMHCLNNLHIYITCSQQQEFIIKAAGCATTPTLPKQCGKNFRQACAPCVHEKEIAMYV